MPQRLVGIVVVLALMGAFVAGNAGAQNPTVSAQSNDTFSNAEVTVTQGGSVTFSNSGGRHNVRFDGEATGDPSPANTTAWSFARQFGTVGDFRFYCEVHGGPNGQGMSGIVHVVAAGGPPPGGGPPQQEPGGGSPNPGPGGPAPGGQQPGADLKVSLKLSDSTPLAGRAVRISGVVTPARDGRKLQIQKRLRNGKFKTIATTHLHAAKGDKSTYSLRLRLSKDTVLRARVVSEDGISRTRKLDVHRAA